jgi:hypothetical protein
MMWKCEYCKKVHFDLNHVEDVYIAGTIWRVCDTCAVRLIAFLHKVFYRGPFE